MQTHTQQKTFAKVLITLSALTILSTLAQTVGAGQTHRPPRNATPGSSLSFLPPVTYDSGGGDAISIAVADLNGDGKPDLVALNLCASSSNCFPGSDGSVAVLLGNGDGTFQPAAPYASGGESPFSVAVADVNGDGKPDIIVANLCASGTNCDSGNGSLGVLLGNGDGTFQAATTFDSGGIHAESLAVADFNGDGKLDLAVAHAYGANGVCCISPALGVLLGNGDGTFQTAVMYGGGGLQFVAVGDVNGDHRPDLVVSKFYNHADVEVFLGNGDGTFQTATVYDSGSPFPTTVVISDLNRDGKLDLVLDHGVTNGQLDSVVSILLGNGDGTFRSAVIYDSGVQASASAAVSDLDGDGSPDLLLAGQSGLGVLLGNGDGTFRAALTYSSGGSLATSVVAVDVNGDGRRDLVTGNVFGSSNSDGAMGVLLNNTTLGKSPTSTSLSSSLNPSTYGQKVTWTATVTSSGSITPTGTVKFTWSIYTIGYAKLDSSGVATFSRSSLNADLYPLTAVYVGDASNLGSTSAVLNQVVLQATSTATLTSSPNPSTLGQAVTFTAKISSPTVIPTGPVTFTTGKTVLGTGQLSGGKATLTVSSLAVGSTTVTATYYGSSNIAKSSASVIQTVQ